MSTLFQPSTIWPSRHRENDMPVNVTERLVAAPVPEVTVS